MVSDYAENHRECYMEEMFSACSNGSFRKVRHLLTIVDWFEEDLENFISISIRRKHMIVTILMINSMANPNINWMMRIASIAGDLRIVEYLVGRGAVSFNWSLRWACTGGHIRIVEYLIKNGATAFRNAHRFCKDRHPEIAEILRKKQTEKGIAFREMRQRVRIQKALR